MQVEAVLWCACCKVAKFEMVREPAKNEGVYTHATRVLDAGQNPNDRLKCTACGGDIARRPQDAA